MVEATLKGGIDPRAPPSGWLLAALGWQEEGPPRVGTGAEHSRCSLPGPCPSSAGPTTGGTQAGTLTSGSDDDEGAVKSPPNIGAKL